MALNAYLTLKGQRQGPITGSVTQKGREGSILVESYTHEVVIPRDPSSGLPTGKRMHRPLIIMKENDRSSPLLWSALVNNENLTTFELRFWTTQLRGGVEVQHYTIRLTNANIASIREYMQDNLDPSTMKFPMREEIAFSYQKIEWIWTDGGITAQDDWPTTV